MASYQPPTQQPPAAYYQLHETAAEKTAQYQLPAVPTQEDSSVVSIKRSLVRGALAILVVLLILVIGLSAGLGVSQRNMHQMETNLQVAQQAVSAAALAPGAATTVTLRPSPPVSPTSTPTPTATVKSDVQCPSINGTIFTTKLNSTSSNSTTTPAEKRFLLLCGIDYGSDEATDIGNVKVKNLDACAEACAKKTNCTGAGWGVIKGDKGPEHTCWMKMGLVKGHNTTGAWGFAQLVGEGFELP